MKFIPIFLFLLTIAGLSFAQQTSCFSRYYLVGVQAFETLDFERAQKQFRAAIICPDIGQDEKQEAMTWLQKANDGYIFKITEKQDSLNEALKNLAEEKKRAVSFAMQSEANRLALLSENERKNENERAALYLAYKALETADEEQTPEHVLAFGYAVSDALAKSMDKKARKYENFYLLEDSATIISQAQEDADKLIQIMDLEESKEVGLKKKDILFTHIAENGDWIITANDKNIATLWNKKGKSVTKLYGHLEPISYAAFSPDYQLILTCSRDNTAKLWNMEGTLLTTFDKHKGNIYYGEFSSEGTSILTRASDGSVYVWDIKGQLLGSILVENTYVNSAIFSPDDQQVLTASSDGTARLWKTDGQLLAKLEGHQSVIKNAFYSPNQLFIVTNGLDHKLKLWSNQGAEILTLKGHENTVNSIQFSPDNSELLTASNDRTSILWDNKGQILQQFKGHRKAVLQANFSSSGNYILTTGKDGFVKLWNKDGQLLMNIDLQSSNIIPAIFSQDEKYIFAVINDRLAKLPLPNTALEMIETDNFFSSTELASFKRDFDVQNFDLN
ncbi:MAG: WD40 repeat domain-containing protein [Bacteroidota bacterium]